MEITYNTISATISLPFYVNKNSQGYGFIHQDTLLNILGYIYNSRPTECSFSWGKLSFLGTQYTYSTREERGSETMIVIGKYGDSKPRFRENLTMHCKWPEDTSKTTKAPLIKIKKEKEQTPTFKKIALYAGLPVLFFSIIAYFAYKKYKSTQSK